MCIWVYFGLFRVISGYIRVSIGGFVKRVISGFFVSSSKKLIKRVISGYSRESCYFGLFWPILGYFGLFWVILSDFDDFSRRSEYGLFWYF